MFLPIRHIANYSEAFETMLTDLNIRVMQEDGVSEEFKKVAVVDAAMAKFRDCVFENFRLNSIKDSLTVNLTFLKEHNLI